MAVSTPPALPIAAANAALTAESARFEMVDRVINGVSLRTYRNAPASHREILLNSRSWGEREYFVFQTERVTFGAHYKAVAHFATALKREFGVTKGDRVAIAMRNYPQWSVAFFAALSIGAIATPLNSWWTGEELAFALNDCEAKLAVVDPERLDRLREHLPQLGLRHVVVARNKPGANENFVSLEAFIGAADTWAALPEVALPDADVGPDDLATLMYTSGTTAKPKGALATHRASISATFNVFACQARHFSRQGLIPPMRDPVNGPQRVALVAIPLFHATGTGSYLIPAMINADKIITVYKWDPLEGLDIIQRERVTTIGGVPAIAWQILEHPKRADYDLNSIQFVTYGGAPAAPELLAGIRRTCPGSLASNGWGMTETCGASSLNFGNDYFVRPNSCGAAAPAVDFKIVGDNGRALGPNQVGELWVRGPNVCTGYWNRPNDTAKTFIEGWVVTGDIGRLDEEGFLYLLDRAKDVLIRGGENVYCTEVEDVLYEHPAVMDAAVVGIPHKVLGDEVGAVVQLKPGVEAQAEDILRFARERLAAFKVPVQIQLQREQLPRNASGKIMKNDLRMRFEPLA